MAIMSVLSAFRKLWGLFQRKVQWDCLVLRLVSIGTALAEDQGTVRSKTPMVFDELHRRGPEIFCIGRVNELLSLAKMGERLLPEDPRKLSLAVDEILPQLTPLPEFPLDWHKRNSGVKNADVELTTNNVICQVEKATQFRLYWDDMEDYDRDFILAILVGTLIGLTRKTYFPRNVCETGFYLAEVAPSVSELQADYGFPKLQAEIPQPTTSWRQNLSFQRFLPAIPFPRPPVNKEQPPLKEKSSMTTLVGTENDDKSSDKQG